MAMGTTIKKAFAATLLAATTLFIPAAVEAKPVSEFKKMSVDDQSRFIADVVNGVAKYLREQGQPELAQRAVNHFNNDKNATTKVLDYVDALQTLSVTKNKAMDTELAVLQVLRDIGIVVPKSVALAVGNNFKETDKRNGESRIARNDPATAQPASLPRPR